MWVAVSVLVVGQPVAGCVGGCARAPGAGAVTAGQRRPLLPAVVGPLASAVIARDLGSVIEEMASRHDRAGSVDIARQLRLALAQMCESARLRNLAQAGDTSADATTELPETGGGARSDCPPDAGSRWWSVGQVAEKLSCSPRRVRTLCSERDGRLSATRLPSRGRPYLIDPESVAEYLESRRAHHDGSCE